MFGIDVLPELPKRMPDLGPVYRCRAFGYMHILHLKSAGITVPAGC